MTDEKYMALARSLAECGFGKVDPNPLVGAVIVKDGKTIGTGWHERFGGPHAERNALASCAEDPKGATLYVTLEPSCHWGKTPPCTDATLAAGIRRVVVGSRDPNPLVSGGGTKLLREHGIEVTEGVLKTECDALNAVFFHYIQTKTPFVILKYAMTADGKTATVTGASKWITGETARQRVQQDRNRYAAVMVGVGTVHADDPLLTCRVPDGRNPVRVVCDTHLKTPLGSQIVRTAKEVPTILATCEMDAERALPYRTAGCEVLTLPEKNGRVELRTLMAVLGERGLSSVLLEGGGTLNASALEAEIVNRVQTYIAPKIFGGTSAKTPVMGTGIEDPANALLLSPPRVTVLGGDLLLESEVL